MHPLTQAAHFLLMTLFDIFLFLILLRFLFQFLRIDFYNPFAQAIVKLTNPILIPLRRVIPSIKGIDTASLVLLFLVCVIKLILSSLLQYHQFPAIGGLFIWSIGEMILLTLNVFFWAIIIQAVMSWLSPMPGHPIQALLYSLTNPLTQPARRFIKPISGIDFSPLAVLLVLEIVIILVATPIRHLGIAWSM